MKAILRWAWGVEPEEQSLGHEVGKKLFEHVGDLWGFGPPRGIKSEA